MSKVAWINEMLRSISDLFMPKSSGHFRKSAYWWSDEIADMRAVVVRKRREWTRAKGKADRVVTEGKENLYKEALGNYRQMIKKAKNNAWRELTKSIEADPWGLSYKLTMNKLKPMTHPFTEVLPREIVEKIVDALFPTDRDEIDRDNNLDRFMWLEDYKVSETEIKEAMTKYRGDKKAPGPDRILGGIDSYWVAVVHFDVSDLTASRSA